MNIFFQLLLTCIYNNVKKKFKQKIMELIKLFIIFFYRIIRFKINYKTIYFNFKYLPLKTALKTPILINKNVYLRTISGSISIEKNINFGMINIGRYAVGIFDEKKSRTIWQVSGKVIFKGNANIGHGSKISVQNDGILEFGNNFTITAESSIICTKSIKFGDNNLLSWDIQIMDSDLHEILNDKNEIINTPKAITIGNKVWICSRCLILKGSNIPNNSIIGGQSVVSKKLYNENSLYTGNPIICVKENVNWK